MKVTEEMIRPEMRFMGRIYSRTSGSLKIMKHPALRWAPHSAYLRRGDGSMMRVLISDPGKKKNYPGMLWIHGGGYVSGLPEMAYFTMARIAMRRCVVVSPDYRMAGMAPFPASLKDCVLALAWMRNHARELRIDPSQIFVGGESAGGGLAVALCMYGRDRGTVRIACQFPLYPMLDDRCLTESMKENNAPVWSEKQNREAWKFYLRGLNGIPVYAAPGRADDVSGLPPAVTFVGGIDPFRDETAEYCRKLKAVGIPVRFRIYKGCYHAFDMMVPWSKAAGNARIFFEEALEEAIEKYHVCQV